MPYTIRQREEERHKRLMWGAGMTPVKNQTSEQRALVARATPDDVGLLNEAASVWGGNPSMLEWVAELATQNALTANGQGRKYLGDHYTGMARDAAAQAARLLAQGEPGR